MKQTTTYRPSKEDYDNAVEKHLKALNAKDYSALQSPRDEPTVTIETEATTGFSFKGIGVSQGRSEKNMRSASEEALKRYEDTGGTLDWGSPLGRSGGMDIMDEFMGHGGGGGGFGCGKLREYLSMSLESCFDKLSIE